MIAGFDCNVFEEKSTDPEVIYSIARRALATMEENGKPCFLKLHYYRYLEHVGINEDFDAGYRSRKDYLQWLEIDPIALQKKKLQTIGVPTQKLLDIEKTIEEQIERSIDYAQQSVFADVEELHKGVFTWA